MIKSKGNIIVVECISSAVNYIKDIYNMGYTPISLEPYVKPFERAYMRKFHDEEIRKYLDLNKHPLPKIVMAKKTYGQTLDMVKTLSPVAILPGSDKGIELATHLAHDLGLIGNDPAIIPKMRNKYVAQKALQEAGIRSIESQLVDNYNEALAFYKKMASKGKSVVVKPVSGISSFGVFVCRTEEQLHEAFFSDKKNFIYTMLNGQTGKVLIQECIEGTEYIVNSVSSQGKHKITYIGKYEKVELPGKGKIYDYDISIKSTDPIADELTKYELSVVQAIGIKVGATHCEIMVDKDGPVLIEANCRLMGGQPDTLMYESIGISESYLSLQTYLNPSCIDNINSDFLFSDTKQELNVTLKMKKTQFIRKLFLNDAFKDMPEFRMVSCRKNRGFFPETVNFSTGLAGVYFILEKPDDICRIVSFCHDLENNHPEKLYKGIYIPVLCPLIGKLMI